MPLLPGPAELTFKSAQAWSSARAQALPSERGSQHCHASTSQNGAPCSNHSGWKGGCRSSMCTVEHRAYTRSLTYNNKHHLYETPGSLGTPVPE